MAKNAAGGSSNVPFNYLKLLWLNNKGTTHVRITNLVPFIFTEVGRLCKLAVFAPHFDNAAALGHLGAVVALLGDISSGPQPEGTVHLYIMNILSVIQKGKRTEVALRTSAA